MNPQHVGIMSNVVGQVLLPPGRGGDREKRGWGAKALMLSEEIYEFLEGGCNADLISIAISSSVGFIS